MNIESANLFHVGDDLFADIITTKTCGIMNYHYTKISEVIYRFPYLRMESMVYGPVGESIYPLSAGA